MSEAVGTVASRANNALLQEALHRKVMHICVYTHTNTHTHNYTHTYTLTHTLTHSLTHPYLLFNLTLFTLFTLTQLDLLYLLLLSYQGDGMLP